MALEPVDGSGAQVEQPKPKSKTVTEAHVANLFAASHGGKLAFCHSAGVWREFDGAIWRAQKQPDAFNEIHVTSVKVSAGADNWAKMHSSAFAGSVERLAKARPEFSHNADDWDIDTFVLGTPTGAVDLRTGAFRKGSAKDMLTKSTAVAPDDFEDCPKWLAFLDEATGGDEALIQFLQRWAGYCLTGDTREQSLVFLYGQGGNGKGVFKDTIGHIMGSYAVTAPMETFTRQKNGPGHSTELAMLHGARMVTTNETEADQEWAEARIKQLTGADPITARFLNKDNFTFQPTFKLTIIGNNQPSLRTVDEAMMRRLCMVPFTRRPAVKDDQLAEKLRDEWPGILRWLINGAVDWLANGLPRPEVVRAATDDYFDEQDVMQHWIDEFCIVDKGNDYRFQPTADLFKSWSGYVKQIGETAGSVRGFSFTMQRLGYSKINKANQRCMAGLSLKRDGRLLED